MHVEQWLLPFVHHQVCGESTWFIVPHSERAKLQRLVQRMAAVRRAQLARQERRERERDAGGQQAPSPSAAVAAIIAPVLFYSKSLFPPPSLLVEFGIRYHRVVLQANQVLIA